MKKLSLLVVPFLLLGVSGAQADTYHFTFSGDGGLVIGTGTLTTSNTLVTSNTGYGAGYAITGVTGTLVSPDLGGPLALPLALIPPSSPGAQTTSPSGYFYYDDLLFPDAPSAPADNWGWLFNVSGAEVNVFSSGAAGVLPVFEYENNGFNTPVTFTITENSFVAVATPEPGFYSVLVLGLTGLFAVARRRKNA